MTKRNHWKFKFTTIDCGLYYFKEETTDVMIIYPNYIKLIKRRIVDMPFVVNGTIQSKILLTEITRRRSFKYSMS